MTTLTSGGRRPEDDKLDQKKYKNNPNNPNSKNNPNNQNIEENDEAGELVDANDRENIKEISISFRMPEQSNDYRVVVFGGAGVGKSSLVLRFVRGTFKETYVPTIEDTYRQVISCNKNICTLQITDTTGSHQFPAMQRLSITKAHAFILVYSVTSKRSLEELHTMWATIHEIRPENMRNVPVMIVGNKIDEVGMRELDYSAGQDLANSWNACFMETSAKTNYNVQELFQQLLDMERHRNITIQLENANQATRGNWFQRTFRCSLF